jgi:MFS family permease
MLSLFGALGFALLADGFWSALLFQAIAGAGLAGTYMPGLRILSDHIAGKRQSRSVAFYTSTFGVGASLSLWFAGTVATAVDWRWAFGLAAIGPAIAGMLVMGVFSPRTPDRVYVHSNHLLDFRPIFRNRSATRYILAYAAHCWELFGFRSWIVVFFAFALSMQSGAEHPIRSAATFAAIVNLLGPGASILGNELASHWGRRRVVLAIMTASTLLACTVGFSATLPWSLVLATIIVYFLVIMGDSAALTAGVVATSFTSQRGATMAVYSMLGFGAGFVAPVVFGGVLDLAGGNNSPLAWGFAFASLALGYILAPLVLIWLRGYMISSRQR